MKKDDHKILGIIFWVMLSLYGCATTRDVQILDKDIQRIDSQVKQVQNQNLKEKDDRRKEIEAFRTELTTFKKETETNLSSLQAENQKTRADLFLRLETIQSETRTLSTGVAEYKDYLNKPSRDISRIKEDVEVRLRILEEKGKTFEERNRSLEEKNRSFEEKSRSLEEKNRSLEEKNRSLEEKSRSLEEKNRSYEERLRGIENQLKGLDFKMASKISELEKSIPPKESTVEPKTPSTTAGNLYKDAYEAFQKGDLDGSRRKFEAFLKTYPNMELSDNAQFWIGETYFLKKDFEKAILEYEKVIVKYPEGDKVSSALLKQALAFLELGDKTNGRNLLKRVIDRYPQTEQADIAKKKLETIK